MAKNKKSKVVITQNNMNVANNILKELQKFSQTVTTCEILVDDLNYDFRAYLIDPKDINQMFPMMRIDRIKRDSGYLIINYVENNKVFTIGLMSDKNAFYIMKSSEYLVWYNNYAELLKLPKSEYIETIPDNLKPYVCLDRSLFKGIENPENETKLSKQQLKNVSENFAYDYIIKPKNDMWMEYYIYEEYFDAIIDGAIKYAIKMNYIFAKDSQKWKKSMLEDLNHVVEDMSNFNMAEELSKYMTKNTNIPVNIIQNAGHSTVH